MSIAATGARLLSSSAGDPVPALPIIRGRTPPAGPESSARRESIRRPVAISRSSAEHQHVDEATEDFGPLDPPAGGRLPDAGLAQRGRRCRAGDLAPAQPSFDEIAPIVGRSSTAARQLASRARTRVQGAATPDTDLARQRKVVDAFFAAARDGDFAALVAVLDPDVLLRSDGGALRPVASIVARGAETVASRALTFARLSPFVRPALVNGAAGVVVAPGGRPFSVMGFTIRRGRIVEIDALTDPQRLRRLDLAVLDETGGQAFGSLGWGRGGSAR